MTGRITVTVRPEHAAAAASGSAPSLDPWGGTWSEQASITTLDPPALVQVPGILLYSTQVAAVALAAARHLARPGRTGSLSLTVEVEAPAAGAVASPVPEVDNSEW